MTNTNIIVVALMKAGPKFSVLILHFFVSHLAVNIVVFISIQLSGVLDRGKA